VPVDLFSATRLDPGDLFRDRNGRTYRISENRDIEVLTHGLCSGSRLPCEGDMAMIDTNHRPPPCYASTDKTSFGLACPTSLG
jgi:hypothetical protein